MQLNFGSFTVGTSTSFKPWEDLEPLCKVPQTQVAHLLGFKIAPSFACRGTIQIVLLLSPFLYSSYLELVGRLLT